MIPEARRKYNSFFTEEKYNEFMNDLCTAAIYPVDFRISETPLFLTKDLAEKLIKTSGEIMDQLQAEEFKKRWDSAVPYSLAIPGKECHPSFLQIDFAIAEEEGQFVPKLIELQAFPTTYCFEVFLDQKYREYFFIPEYLTSYFNGFNKESYLSLLKQILLDDTDPKNVILVDIDPENQKTRVDFAMTREMAGIEIINIANILKRGKKLFYKKDKKEIPVKRIYNRVIYDELIRKKINLNFKFKDELDVEWVDHPGWFFRISKHSLPLLKGSFIPKTFYLSELDELPEDLENYILKPLFSFSGYGVQLDLTKELLSGIKDKPNYILQQKVEYAPLILTPDGYSKAEIRMIYLWKDNPVLVYNLTRISKGRMMGVNFNKDKTWVGSSVAYHPIINVSQSRQN